MPEPLRSDEGARRTDHVAASLTAFVNRHLMARSRPIQADDRFEAVGIDSMAFLRVLLFIEAEFGFWIPEEDLAEENIASPRALARYICGREAWRRRPPRQMT